MPNYRRAKQAGGTFFFTVVTHRRLPVLTQANSREILRRVIHRVRLEHPFTIDAWVLLPDHMHCIWTLPCGDADFSKRWGLIKAGFTREMKRSSPQPERHWWQHRFWEHQIRGDLDFERHVHYIHYNPVKHGLVSNVKDWPYSTFHRFVRDGLYEPRWGEEISFQQEDHFGE
ncbi:MAG: REP-associated tyrosine transposase [Thermodesulfobacteriota bacterium]